MVEFSPFNNLKCLIHSNNIKSILTGKFRPPVSVEIDASNICNHNCIWCMFKDFKRKKAVSIPKDILMDSIKDLAGFGVKGVTFTGGGEPLSSPYILEAIQLAKRLKLKVSLITNGGLLDKDNIKIIAKTCEFVRISLDAGTAETHNKLHRPLKGNFNHILKMVHKLSKKTMVGIAFLVHPKNYNEITSITEKVKELGASYIQIRPVYMNKTLALEVIEVAEKQIKVSKLLYEDDKFKVYGIMHRFDEHKDNEKGFMNCLSTPLISIIGADCNVYLCCQFRGKTEWSFGNIRKKRFSEIWNNKKQKELISKIDINKCPPCRYKIYNQCIEQVFLKNNMHKEFL